MAPSNSKRKSQTQRQLVNADKVVEDNLTRLKEDGKENCDDVKRRVSQRLDLIYESRISIEERKTKELLKSLENDGNSAQHAALSSCHKVEEEEVKVANGVRPLKDCDVWTDGAELILLEENKK